MADITQRVVVKVDYEGNLKSGIDEVKQLGKVAEDDVKAFQSLQKEINAGINDALQEAGVSMKDFAEASKKATDPNQFKSLKQQIREAKDEATGLAAKFGDTSKQAIDAQKKVAKLTDQLGDFNDRVKALNPDAKFNAVNQTLQGTIGAFQGITGAAQLFGAENKALNETLMKMQGLLNLTQGVNSVMQLKDAFTNLNVVLGLTAVAEEGVTAGAMEMAAALGPYIAVAGAAIAIGYKLTESVYEEADAMKARREEQEKALAASDESARGLLALIGLNDKQVQIMKEQGKNELQILQYKKAINAADYEYLKLASEKSNDAKLTAQIIKATSDNRLEADLLELQIGNEIHKMYIQRLMDAQKLRETQEGATNSLRAQFDKEYNDQSGKLNEQLTLRKTINEAQYNDEKAKRQADLVDELGYWQDRLALAVSFGKDTQQIEAEIGRVRHQLNLNDKKDAEEAYQEKLKYAQKIYDYSSQLAVKVADMYKAQTDSQYQYEEAALQDQLKRKEISQKQYDSKLRALKRKQAEDDKKYAIFQALINAAGAIIRALTQPDPISAVAFASALSAIEIASIIARPIPKFAKGSLFVNGGNGGVDDIPAYLNRGEAVIPTHTNKAYAPAIDAIYHNKIHPSVLNAFVHAHKSGKTSNSMIANMELMRAVKGNGTVNVRNASDLAKMIGAEVANNLNHRRR